MFSKGRPSISLEDLRDKINEVNMTFYYIGIKSLPCVIHSPLRRDNNPSFGIYMGKNDKVYWIDYATKESGSIYDLLCRLWNCSFIEMLIKINNDLHEFKNNTSEGVFYKDNKYSKKNNSKNDSSNTSHTLNTLECKVREWEQHDINYWGSYGISLQWLKYAEVYPISHKIITNRKGRFVFSTDKYAYAYVEHKENKVTLKIYQPFNKRGFKWSNKHDRSVISLWSKIPKSGDKVVICSSLKDALCLWANTGIPAIAVQGEGYNMSETAINELKKRFNKVYILFDNDIVGLKDGEKLSKSTGFINIVLPQFKEGKDISDFYKSTSKENFSAILLSLFEDNKN